jgi:hypothetical protein
MNYVDLNIVRYAAMTLAVAEQNGETIACQHGYIPICGKPAEYLVPDAVRPGGGGQDLEQRPAWFCREHLEELLGRPPEEQPHFRRLRGAGEDEEE